MESYPKNLGRITVYMIYEREVFYMAHECPVCGMICYCNGDIDDVCLNIEEDVLGCTHCEEYEEDFEDETDYDDFYF